MSEAELHFIKAQAPQRDLAEAHPRELITPLPIRLVYDTTSHVIPDPDTAVGALAHLFRHLRDHPGQQPRAWSAFDTTGLSFPWRHRRPRKGEDRLEAAGPPRRAADLAQLPLRARSRLGRHRDIKLPGGKLSRTILPREEWISFIPGAHPGYITLDQYDANRAAGRQRRRARP